MLQLPSGVVSSTCSQSSPRSVSPHAGQFQAPVLNVQPSCLDIIRDMYRGQGFSVHGASFLVQSVQPQRVLSMTESVCVSIRNFGDFLLFLFEDLNLAASTMRVYKAAISSALLPLHS